MSSPPIAGRLTGRRHLFHPSRRRLEAWLEGVADDIDDHVADCAHCAARLEELASPPSAPLRTALLRALAPPADLQPRLRTGMVRRLEAREDLQLMASMLGVPGDTLRTLLSPPLAAGPTSSADDVPPGDTEGSAG